LRGPTSKGVEGKEGGEGREGEWMGVRRAPHFVLA